MQEIEQIAEIREAHLTELEKLGAALRIEKRRALYVQRLPNGFLRVFVSAPGPHTPERKRKERR